MPVERSFHNSSSPGLGSFLSRCTTDVLLGLDWQIFVEAIIDFSKMTMALGPLQDMAIHTQPRSKTGYVRMRHKQNLAARHTTKLYCQVTGDWPYHSLAVFDGKVALGNSINLMAAVLLHPDPATLNFFPWHVE